MHRQQNRSDLSCYNKADIWACSLLTIVKSYVCLFWLIKLPLRRHEHKYLLWEVLTCVWCWCRLRGTLTFLLFLSFFDSFSLKLLFLHFDETHWQNLVAFRCKMLAYDVIVLTTVAEQLCLNAHSLEVHVPQHVCTIWSVLQFQMKDNIRWTHEIPQCTAVD